jgi:hypothetical protein
LLGLDPSTVFQMRREEYSARMVARFCEVGLEHYRNRALLINYRQLPGIVGSALFDFFQVRYSGADLDRMHHIAKFDAKNPTVEFVHDAAAKGREATDLVRQMADLWVNKLYEQLEAARKAQAVDLSAYASE